MEQQKELMNNTQSKKSRIDFLKFQSFSNYSKIISEYGNYESKVLILGISPTKDHYGSDSFSSFAFDINLNQTQKSVGVICKVFARLGLNISDFFWDNIYKVPEDMLTNESKITHINYLKSFIQIINPKLIVCLGTECETIVNSLKLKVDIRVKKCYHPGAHLRGYYDFDEYCLNWKRLNLEEYIK